MSAAAAHKCDIIVITWNKLDYIENCVESILRCTDVPSRLVIVDNASDEETKAYLRGIKANAMVDVKLIFNDSNLGPGPARNIALRQLEAPYACFVDSDVVVTPGWLSIMIRLAESESQIGMVNPSSNNFNQLPPDDHTPIDEYARSLVPLGNAYIEVGHAITFCLLVKKAVVDKIGLLDEGYVLAIYEDTDYSMKATSAGYLCVIAKAAYVWHYGHGSTGRVKKMDEIAEKNKERFRKKWGKPLRILLCARASADKGAFREVLASAIKLARSGNYLYIAAAGKDVRANRESVFERAGFVEHANVHFIPAPSTGFGWFCLWLVLIKRKKMYDLVISDDAAVAALVKRFRFLHRAQVVRNT